VKIKVKTEGTLLVLKTKKKYVRKNAPPRVVFSTEHDVQE
jgi:hypothetical protein